MTSAQGLTSAEAKKLLAKYGRNEISRKKESVFFQFLGRFKNPLVLILLAAAIISFFSDDPTSASIIIVIVLVSGVLGFLQFFQGKQGGLRARGKSENHGRRRP